MSEEPTPRARRRSHLRMRHAAIAVLGLLARVPSCSGCHGPDWDCICMALPEALSGTPSFGSGSTQ